MFKKLNKEKKVIILIVIVLCLAFYWYELRPINIKKSCYKEAVENFVPNHLFTEVYYKGCLWRKGL